MNTKVEQIVVLKPEQRLNSILTKPHQTINWWITRPRSKLGMFPGTWFLPFSHKALNYQLFDSWLQKRCLPQIASAKKKERHPSLNADKTSKIRCSLKSWHFEKKQYCHFNRKKTAKGFFTSGIYHRGKSDHLHFWETNITSIFGPKWVCIERRLWFDRL